MPTEHKFSSARLGKPVPEQRTDEDLRAYLKRRDRVAEANHKAGLLTPGYRYMRDNFAFANKLASARTYFAEEIVKLYGTRKRASQPPAPPSRPPSRPDRPVGKSPSFAHLNNGADIHRVAVQYTAGQQAAEIMAGAAEATRPMRVQKPAEGSVAAEILAAAKKAATPTSRKLPAKGSVARAIIDAGRKRRGEI